MYCPECGRKLDEESKFCPECGHKLADGKVLDTVKEKAVHFEEKISERLPENLRKNKKRTYAIFGGVLLVVVIFAIWFFNRGYSQNILFVRGMQNGFLEEDHLTFGQVMDYALVNEKWKDTVYEGKPAVMLTGTYMDNGDSMVAIIYVGNYESWSESIPYYRRGSNELDGLHLASDATEYASKMTSSYFGQ